MAMTDYFYPCKKIEEFMASDGLGGFETVEREGVEFMGLAVRLGVSEQLVGALRGSEETQYHFHTYTNVPLKKDDKVMWTENGAKKYLRLTSSAHVNTELSAQTEWVSYDAESYIPTKIFGGV